ncbi:MAG TPA: PQQ-dependent sugar dehydrogenase [Nevskiaceae bacterium]|nr:PQQ-dependent sugar dehydrogenase [Nevskiaceae bacterium]
MTTTRLWCLCAAWLAGCGSGTPLQTQGQLADQSAPAIALRQAYGGQTFDGALFLTHAPGDAQHVYVVQQSGVIWMLDNDDAGSNAHVFADLSAEVTDHGGEQGLLGLAFDPDYAGNGRFYVNYIPAGGTLRTVIAQLTAAADRQTADPGSEVQLLTYDQPYGNHKGGWLGFGPDGLLYISAGDGGGTGDPDNHAQNLASPLGKILRIAADGSIPPDNPFVSTPGARGEIYAYGLRNPFRASFDRSTGELWAGDAGQSAWEEIDRITAGGNYGWRKFEGNHVYNADDPAPANALAPVFEYGHDSGRCVVIGGYVYRGNALTSLAGRYIFGDYCSGEIFALDPAGNAAAADVIALAPARLTSFGEDGAGELYVTLADGRILRIAPGSGA